MASSRLALSIAKNPVDTWNVHESTLLSRNRTNNLWESWNNGLPDCRSLSRLGVKATTLKTKAKAKDLAFEAKAKAKDLAFEAKAKAKDMASKAKAKAKAKDDVKANVNMVRCSVKTSKHMTFIAGLVMTNFILIARFSTLLMKLTVSF